MEPSQLQQVQPASLLWAHELRRENVHLVSQMDKLNTILTSATNTISTLHESVEILTARMQHLEEQHKQQQQEFEHKLIEFEDDRRESQNRAVRLEQAYEQVDTLVVENGALRRELTDIRVKVDAVETGNGTLREEVGQASKKVNTVESGNKALTRELGKVSRELHALIAENEGLLKGEIQGVSEKFDTFETENGTLKWNLDNVIQTFGRIESENDGVKERVCVLEKGAAVQEKHTARLMKWMSMNTMGDNKETRGIIWCYGLALKIEIYANDT
jgi:chromosome segregation ATPase